LKFKDSLALPFAHDRHRICLDCDGVAEFRVKDCAAESGQTLKPARHLEDWMTSAKTDNLENLDQAIVRAAESTAASVRTARAAIGAVIFGQEQVVEQALITVLAGGHALLVGVPGLAKTKLVDTMGTVLGLDARRIQFTPDLMPSDILGSEVLEESTSGKRAFRFIKGPVFAQLLLADEINRASPRTQSALLQAMQEYHVTIAGQRHDLPRPFHVLSTQNPIEQEGTYPLPEAQLDRFLMEIDVHYPDREAERRILFDTTGVEETKPKAAMTADDLLAAQRLVRRIPVGQSVIDAILTLVRSARPGGEDDAELTRHIAWGPSPRASQALMLAVRARALLDGRLAPSIDDVIALAEPVLKHRMALTFSARADGETIAGVIGRLKARLG
jgi:MoxR-like ATPase